MTESEFKKKIVSIADKKLGDGNVVSSLFSGDKTFRVREVIMYLNMLGVSLLFTGSTFSSMTLRDGRSISKYFNRTPEMLELKDFSRITKRNILNGKDIPMKYMLEFFDEELGFKITFRTVK